MAQISQCLNSVCSVDVFQDSCVFKFLDECYKTGGALKVIGKI